jgi:hypothetical protein
MCKLNAVFTEHPATLVLRYGEHVLYRTKPGDLYRVNGVIIFRQDAWDALATWTRQNDMVNMSGYDSFIAHVVGMLSDVKLEEEKNV